MRCAFAKRRERRCERAVFLQHGASRCLSQVNSEGQPSAVEPALNAMTDKPAAGFPSADFWRSLSYFNLYRLVLSSLFVFLAWAFGSSLSLGARNWTIFFAASLVYVVAVVLSYV